MKSIIQNYLENALQSILHAADLSKTVTIPVEYSRTPEHGDFSSSVALSLSKSLKIKPMDLAQQILNGLNSLSLQDNPFTKIEIASPGFINFFVQPSAWLATLPIILAQQDQYGRADFGKGKHILVEFVSSNPTGPLHVGHGRAAAHGDILIRLLKKIGYAVHAEYYINDAGRQMDILTCSIWLRYLQARKSFSFSFPLHAYQGNYVKIIAKKLEDQYGAAFYYPMQTLPTEKSKEEDHEKQLDALIQYAKESLGQEKYNQLRQFGLDYILKDMRADLADFNVHFDNWFSENSLIQSKSVQNTIQRLNEKGHTYQSEGNLWFRSTAFGDDKDRVLLRANGQPTYFAVDAAYRLNILETRKFETVINVLGADHHGYLMRIHAVIQALEYSPQRIIFNILQMVSLYRGHQKIPLSTRSGEFVTLRALREEVGNEAARVFFVLKKSNQGIDFDLNLAKSQSHQNPVYYLQYAYARIASIQRQLASKGLNWDSKTGIDTLRSLTLAKEIQLIKQLAQYPSLLIQAATQYEPYLLLQYLRELVKDFHSYYNCTPILTQSATIRNARFTLIKSIQQVLKNSFSLLGIKPLDKM